MPNVQFGFQGVSEILNLHPIFVHFPIALLLAAVGFYVVGGTLKKEPFLIVGKWNLFAGTVGAVLAVWTGLDAAKTVPHGGGTHEIMMMHQNLGYLIIALSGLLSIWVLASKTNIPAKLKGIFIVLLVILGFVIVQTSDLGGRMVFLNGVGVGQKSMMQAESGHEHGGHENGSKEHAGDEHSSHDH